MTQNNPVPATWQPLTDEELAYFERASQTLREQLQHTQADPVEQVRMRFLLWMMEASVETKRTDRALLDSLCREDKKGREHNA